MKFKRITKLILAVILFTSSLATNTLISKAASPLITYSAHCQDIGWTPFIFDGTAGTTGQNRQMEGVKINLTNANGGVTYSAHVQDIGWMEWVKDGNIAGTTGQNRKMEAVKVSLYGDIANNYSVEYRAHVQDIGWMEWVKDGNIAGTTGQNRKMEAVQIRLVPKNNSSSSNTNTWQMPMNNAYCTWRSKENWSWATYTNNSSNRDYHLGLDIYGTNGIVYATSNGTVVAASSSNSGANGRYIIIKHTIDNKTVYSFYAHLSKVNVSVGQTVSKGDSIGVAGGSGYGSNNYYGTHLHFAIVDTLWTNGGYYGYSTKFTGNKVNYSNVTYFNPIYIINNNKLP